MSNLEKYNQVFSSVFGLAAADVESAAFKQIRAWDSVGHVNLISQLEETFDISLDPDDIMDLKSYLQGKDIIAKYGIEV